MSAERGRPRQVHRAGGEGHDERSAWRIRYICKEREGRRVSTITSLETSKKRGILFPPRNMAGYIHFLPREQEAISFAKSGSCSCRKRVDVSECFDCGPTSPPPPIDTLLDLLPLLLLLLILCHPPRRWKGSLNSETERLIAALTFFPPSKEGKRGCVNP